MAVYVASHDDDVEVRPLLAQAYWKLRQNKEAEQVVDAVLLRSPKIAEVLWLKGELVRARGENTYMNDFRRAVECPDAGPKILSRYALELLDANQDEPARRYLNLALEAGSKDPRVLIALGELAAKDRQYDSAEGLLSQAVQADPNADRAFALLADVQKSLGKLDAAARTLQRGAEIAHGFDRASLLMQLGELDRRQDKLAPAAEAYVQACNDRLLRGDAALGAAKCYYALGRLALAMQYIDIAAEFKAGDAEMLTLKRQIEDARFKEPPQTQPASPS
jgi:tetratricopeptide (TPR) repeat protein